VSGPTRVANFPWTTPPDLSSLPTPGPHESPEFMEALAAGRVVSVHIAGVPSYISVGAFRWDQHGAFGEGHAGWVEVDPATIPREVIADFRDGIFRRAGQTVFILDEPATGVGRPSPLAGLSKLDDALARLHDLDPTGAEDDDYADAIATADGLRAVIDRLVDEWRPE
jgi:hypothetical protein